MSTPPTTMEDEKEAMVRSVPHDEDDALSSPQSRSMLTSRDPSSSFGSWTANTFSVNSGRDPSDLDAHPSAYFGFYAKRLILFLQENLRAVLAVLILGSVVLLLFSGSKGDPGGGESQQSLSAEKSSSSSHEATVKAGLGESGVYFSEDPCPVYTYLPVLAEGEERLVELWKRSWAAAGWAPKVFLDADLTESPLIREVRAVWDRRENLAATEDQFQTIARWAMMAGARGGLFSHFHLFNFGFTPPADCAFSSDRLTIFEGLYPDLVAGSAAQFQNMAMLCARRADTTERVLDSMRDGVEVLHSAEFSGIVKGPSEQLEDLVFHAHAPKPIWEAVQQALCSHAAQSGPIEVFPIPNLPGSEAALQAILDELAACKAAGKVSRQYSLPQAPPLKILLLPLHPAAPFLGDFLEMKKNADSAPKWLLKNFEPSVVQELGITDYLHALENYFSRETPEEVEVNRISKALGRALGVENWRNVSSLIHALRRQGVTLGIYEYAEDDVVVFEAGLGFPLSEKASKNLVEGLKSAWGGVERLHGLIAGEVEVAIVGQNGVDDKLLNFARKLFDSRLSLISTRV